MADRVSKEKRSQMMAGIHSENTSPELLVRTVLHRLGFRYRLHRKDLPGKPDIVLPKYKAVIFVHGCFWHQHAGCKAGHVPKSNKEYWRTKLERNVIRDREAQEMLRVLEWRVLVIWECELDNTDALERRLKKFILGKEE